MEIYKTELNNGIEIPILGLGTWNLRRIECKKIVRKAISMGYRLIDTAESYGNEEEIGEAIKDFNREEIFITSKISPENLGNVGYSLDSSLKKLKTDYLDLYLIHWPNQNMDVKRVLKQFKSAYDERKIRAFGVSNFAIYHLENIIRISLKLNIPVTMNQIEINPNFYQEHLLNYCKKENIAVTAYSPLDRGKIINNLKIKEISKKYNKSPAQIILRWLIQKDIIVIPKTSFEKHLKENMEIFDFELKKYDTKKIENLR